MAYREHHAAWHTLALCQWECLQFSKQGHAKQLPPAFSIETARKKPTSARNDLGLYSVDSCPPVLDKDYLDNSLTCPECTQV